MKFEGMESRGGSVMDIPSGNTLPSKVQEGNMFLLTGTVPILYFGLTTGWSKVITSLDVIAEGATNKYFTPSRVLSTPVSGISTSSTTTQIAATDTLLSALSKLQGQLVSQLATINSTAQTVTSQATTIGNNNTAIASMQQTQSTLQTNMSNHVGSSGSSHGTATSTSSGFMSAADKAKLDAVPTLVTKHVTVDVANSTTLAANTLLAIPEIAFDVVVGLTYVFKFVIGYTSSATANGSRWTLSGPATAWLSYTSRYPLTATTETVNYANAYGIPSACNATSLSTGNLAIVEGIIKPSAAGTVVLQFASESLASVITAKAGSTLTVSSF